MLSLNADVESRNFNSSFHSSDTVYSVP
jgi:hypothetical protein